MKPNTIKDITDFIFLGKDFEELSHYDLLIINADWAEEQLAKDMKLMLDKNIIDNNTTFIICEGHGNNEKRSEMMPVNKAYPIEELMRACKEYIKITNKRISFEYALAKDNNDNLDDAKELVKLLKGMLCHVNLIPINKIENGKYTKSTNDNIIKFRDYLNDNGIVATIRRELGSDIDAACGQLRRAELKKE